MSKSLKSAAKAKSPSDLFGSEPKGRAVPKAAPRAGNAEAGYTAADIEGTLSIELSYVALRTQTPFTVTITGIGP